MVNPHLSWLKSIKFAREHTKTRKFNGEIFVEGYQSNDKKDVNALVKNAKEHGVFVRVIKTKNKCDGRSTDYTVFVAPEFDKGNYVANMSVDWIDTLFDEWVLRELW